MSFRKPSAILWNDIAEVGYPPADTLTIGPQGSPYPRKFLVRGEYTLDCAYMHPDGSGFDTGMDEPVLAWAIVDGF